MSGQLESYRKQIFDFLRTVTIKFEPFAESMGEMDMLLNGITDPHGVWNKYYINLSGQYGPDDTQMTVYSHEEKRMIPFDLDIHSKYPKSASVYKVTNKEYQLLEDKYPQNRGLIQAIAYPLGMTVQEIIDAPNLSLLGCDASLLHINEQESLVNTLKEYLHMVATRWWIPEYSYEDMYPITFWAMLWQSLPMVLMTKRYENIRTPYVHGYHIWEYLTSKGLGDYRDVLSNTQSLWLYRNINYLLVNKGKYNNLTLLAENILKEVYVSLLYKDMRQNNTSMSPRIMTTSTHSDDISVSDKTRSTSSDVSYFTYPEFVSYNVIDNKQRGVVESFSFLNSRMLESDMEYRSSLEFIAETESELGMHNFNELPTKVMELKKEPIDTSNEQLILHFLFDNLMYNYSKDLLSYKVIITDPQTGRPLELNMGDAILLLYWCNYRSIGEMPTLVPNKYTPILAFKTPVPPEEELPETFQVEDRNLLLRSYVNIPLLRSMMGADTPVYAYTSVEEYMINIAEKFQSIEKIKSRYTNSASYPYRRGMDTYLLHTLETGEIEMNLSDKETFYEWRSSVSGLGEIIDLYENNDDSATKYEQFAMKCFDGIFPLIIEGEMLFANSTRAVETLYTSMKNLFVQLCSYHINFLEGSRDAYEYIPIIEPTLSNTPISPERHDWFFNFVLLPMSASRVSTEPTAILDCSIGSYASMVSLTTDMIFPEIEMSFGVALKVIPETNELHYVPIDLSPIELSRSISIPLDFSIQWGDHVDHPY